MKLPVFHFKKERHVDTFCSNTSWTALNTAVAASHVPNSAYLVLPKHSVWSLRFPPRSGAVSQKIKGQPDVVAAWFPMLSGVNTMCFGFTGRMWKHRSEQGVNNSRGDPIGTLSTSPQAPPYWSSPPAPLFIHHFQASSARPSPPVCSALFLDRKWEGSRTGRPAYSQSLSTRGLFSAFLFLVNLHLLFERKLKTKTSVTKTT